ncbi:MAG TPA: BlaI/MecI/CopY family transcriptional regulator [Hungateiclostridium thermocellum]|jgi:BlaI family penicillinase repressor|uniref:Transcriptional repressor, CopY family n=2 Tax=Acetivibrio thermocellus TaxID=1515 RepID=A3DGF3_ACET2|nr:BlaI/MecI/CopY family transcriptional regulator [Acetivibrio thermocellus]CDG36337.1 CopY family transcriptional regulator [Acetivibrio thermocellus BC1]ABN53032.1 transcriptional repressor, CopY family [Acetivibrio thermocellus ATCC 27405]ADU75497.1 transcriptional repressor, CopY family [Acetivibrio thermocellus DSM 1313]ALX09498.1 transcriptional repressor, CopY family [Acetivibrio thermocellus AD2]ANV77252.1 transcriptional repressor, CopY family [Acetivibrio thermocellus DSM 2360]
MKAESQITEAELEVMKILWEYGKATSSQIVERLTETTEWKPKTIQTLITRLVNKGAVGAEKINNKSFVYYPIVSEEQYKSYANKSFLQKLYNGSVSLMLASFVKEQKLSRKDLEFLKQLLDEEE